VLLLQIVLFAAGGYRYPSFVPAATVALYSIPIGMVGIVFLYKAVTKRNVLWADILTFVLVIALAQAIFIGLLVQLAPNPATIVIATVFLAGIIAAFLRFTVRPPSEPDTFIDPLTQRYGERGHNTP
jgi:hypothetical protein